VSARTDFPALPSSSPVHGLTARALTRSIPTVLTPASFGTELTMNNLLLGYFFEYFGVSLQTAGLAASLFGLMNLFARSLGKEALIRPRSLAGLTALAPLP
jgi:hypothetical protein